MNIVKEEEWKKMIFLVCVYVYFFDFIIFNVRKNFVRFYDVIWCIGLFVIEDLKIKYDLILVFFYFYGIFIYYKWFL